MRASTTALCPTFRTCLLCLVSRHASDRGLQESPRTSLEQTGCSQHGRCLRITCKPTRLYRRTDVAFLDGLHIVTVPTRARAVPDTASPMGTPFSLQPGRCTASPAFCPECTACSCGVLTCEYCVATPLPPFATPVPPRCNCLTSGFLRQLAH